MNTEVKVTWPTAIEDNRLAQSGKQGGNQQLWELTLCLKYHFEEVILDPGVQSTQIGTL